MAFITHIPGTRPIEPPPPHPKRLGLGVVGLHEGRTLLLATGRCSKAYPVAGCDLNPEKLGASRSELPDLFYTDDYGALLARPEVGIVAIYTPDSMHADHIVRAFEAGKDADYILLKLDHLGAEVIDKRLPGIREIAKKFANVDPVTDPIPVVPTCHYQMGGVPTNYHGQVVVPDGGGEKIVRGLYAAGECACVSVHGANRLGTNSLLDLLVFGKYSAERVIADLKEETGSLPDLPKDAGDATLARLARLDSATSGETVAKVGADMRRTMQLHCGVFRFPDGLAEGVRTMKEVAERVQHTFIKDKSRVFNTARVEALELDNLVETALSTMVSAEARKESRGAHDRSDYQDRLGYPNGRDDQNWMKHTLWYKEGNRLDYKPVKLKPLTVEAFEPKARVY